MDEFVYDAIKPHAIMVEFLFQGHINPFANLAIGLASKGCTVTYVQTEFIHNQMSQANQNPGFLFSSACGSGLDIRHKTISDGFPLDFDRDLNFDEFFGSIVRDFPARVDELVGRIVETERGRDTSPFLVADAYYTWPPEVAAKYNLVYVSFWPSPAERLSVGYHLALLEEKGTPITYGMYLIFASTYRFIGECHALFALKPNNVPVDNMLDNYKDHIEEITEVVKSKTLGDTIKCSSPRDAPFCPEILIETIMKAHLQSTCTNLAPVSSLIPEVDCLEWLSSKPPCSVLFIAFGSIAPVKKNVIREIAHGLASSGANFVWVLRPDMVIKEENDDVLPPGFQKEIVGRGLIVPWCDQRKVLANPAVGGFLTHCGWSSILESMWFGVPMLCYPVLADQPNNRNMVVCDWKIGMNLCDEQEISRREVEEKIKSLMRSGTEVRMEMKKVKELVHNALAQDGSSHANMNRFLRDLKEKICMMGK
ncbi:hypothetical protein SASPL_148492 [Salvia splendens]|uniref:Glycosyltransferase n=1 Tax=Salvia splendens TaxID=180675 RepID=A0A8X8Z3F2_SALSN|nr:hypothetical protein SASPL_148492 [Salvia splendens]